MKNLPIRELKKNLLQLNSPNYDNIDNLMRKIMKKYNLTAKELHYGFRASNKNKTPDEWIKEKRKMKTFNEFLSQLDLDYIEEGRGSRGQSIKDSEKLAGYIGKRAARNPQNVDKYWEGVLTLKGKSPSGSNILKSAKYSRAKEVNRLNKEDFELYDLISGYLLDEGYADNYNEVDFIIENIEDSLFNELIYEMRKEDKVKGKKKEPRMVEVSRRIPGKLTKGEDGKWSLKKAETHKEKMVSSKVQVGRFKHGQIGTKDGMEGGHGGREMGYRQHLHGVGGLHRGKKKRDQVRVPEPKYNAYQRKRILSRSRAERLGKPTFADIGDTATQKRADAAKKSFGNASRAWSEKAKSTPKKRSAAERMAAAADKLGLKD